MGAVDADSLVDGALDNGFFSEGVASSNFKSLPGALGATPSSSNYDLRACTSIFSFLINSSISFGDLYTFASVLFMIFFALCANLRVYTDSSRCTIYLLAVQIKVVFELPPSASLRKKVNLESLKGTCGLPSVRDLIQIPREVRLRLIFLASSSTLPLAPVLSIRSLPAKSTRLSLPVLDDPSLFFWVYSITKIV